MLFLRLTDTTLGSDHAPPLLPAPRPKFLDGTRVAQFRPITLPAQLLELNTKEWARTFPNLLIFPQQ